MGSGLISIGITGIAAAQQGLLATEHNVVNANTPGYSRQTTVQATNIAINTGAGAFGQGVHVQTVKRVYDQYLVNQVNTAQTKVSQLDEYYSNISQIDGMLADAEAGLSPALQDFFTGVQQVAANPSLLAARQSMVSSAQTLVARFQNLEGRLSELSDDVNSRITDTVSAINAYATQIADINQRIVLAQSAYSQPPNDLLDTRDRLVNELNSLVKVSTSANGDGSFNVFVGSGQQLVVGSQVQEMVALTSSADPGKIVVGLKNRGGVQELPELLLNGGQLGGLIQFRSDSLSTVNNDLGRIAASLALTFNAQFGLGQNLLGQIAGDAGFASSLFTLSNPSIVPNRLNTGAGAMTLSFEAPLAPAGPDYSGNFTTKLVASDYQLTYGAGGSYTITRLTDNASVASGTAPGAVSFDGLSLSVTAAGANGDKFTLQPYSGIARNIAVDTRVAANVQLINAGAPMRVTQGLANTGGMKVSQGIVGVGYSAASLPVTMTTTATTLNGVPGAWTAVYSDGTTSTGPGNINLSNGSATLTGVNFSGMSFKIDGTPASGDSFVIERNAAGVQDGRNAVLFAKLQTQNTVAGGTATYQSAYAQIVADNGIRTREARIQSEAQSSVLEQAQATRDALSGVNLDEEAANMLKYQQAYQAASKIIEIGNTLFQTLLSIGR
jgi:flagellar hook-associated protein 1